MVEGNFFKKDVSEIPKMLASSCGCHMQTVTVLSSGGDASLFSTCFR